MKYPNLNLYGDLTACEDNLLEMINSNFFKIDSLWMLRVIDIVDDLPLSPVLGDIYVLKSGIYEYEYSLKLFDGAAWQDVPLKNGMYFFVLDQNDFYYVIDGVLTPFTNKYGNVKGPDVSLNNSIARFDGETGKFITDSGIVIDDENSISGIRNIYSESSHSSFSYSGKFIGEKAHIGKIYADDILSQNITAEYLGSSISKTDNLISDMLPMDWNDPTAKAYGLINYLGVEFSGQEINILTHERSESSFFFLIKNKSGGVVSIENTGNVTTPTDDTIEIPNNQSVWILFDKNANLFSVISGMGGSGSGVGGVDILFADNFDSAKNTDYVSTGVALLTEDESIHGKKSMKLVHPNLGYSQYAKTYDVPKAFEGSAMRFKLTVKTDADTDIGSLAVNSIYNGDTTHILLTDVPMQDGENVFLLQFPNEEGSFYYNVRAFNEVGNPVSIIDDVVLEKDLGYSTAKDLTVEGSSILMGEIVTGGVHEDESTGEDVILSDLDGHIIELTDSGLISIAGISHAQNYTNFKIWNKTGNVVVFKHDSSDAVGREKIFTNSKMPFYLEDNAILEVVTSEDGNIITTKDSPYVQYEQGDESDWQVVARGNAGQSITAGVTDIPFIPVSNNTEGGITFNGAQFSVSEDGEYSITTRVLFSSAISGAMSLFEDGAELNRMTPAGIDDVKTFSITTILTKEKIYSIRKMDAGGTLNSSNPLAHHLTITRRQMKLKGSVDVTPFVELPEMPVITPWSDPEPITITATTTNPTKGVTRITDLTEYRQVGEDLEVRYKYLQSSAGVAGSGDYLYQLPSGLEFDDSVPKYTGAGHHAASFYDVSYSLGANGGTISSDGYKIVPYDSNKFRVYTGYTGSSTGHGFIGGSSFGYNLASGDTAYSFTLKFKGKGLKGTVEPVAVADTGKIGEVIFSGNPSAPKGFIATDNKTIGTTGDYNTYKYFELYKQIWNFPSLSTVATDAYSISSAKGASAEADWGAGKLIRVNFTENEVFIRAKGSARDLGSYEADELKSHQHDTALVTGAPDQPPQVFGYGGTHKGVTGNWSAGGAASFLSSSTGGTETRPKNVALNAYIRYSADLQIYVNKMPKRYIVETYQNGTDWYEVNNDGWVRQGGQVSTGVGGNQIVTYLIPMKDSNPRAMASALGYGSVAANFLNIGISGTPSDTQIVLYRDPNMAKNWSVEGYGDSAAVKALGATPSYV